MGYRRFKDYRTFCFFTLIFFCSIFLYAGIPQQINIQGQLTNWNGSPITNGNYTCTFNLYYSTTGGSTIFSETTYTLTVNNGIFNYLLGTNTPLSLAFGTTYWLGINVNGDGEMTPRQPIVSVGNAFKAWNSDSANSATFANTASTATTLTSAANINWGTLADARLSTNVPLLNANNTFSDGVNISSNWSPSQQTSLVVQGSSSGPGYTGMMSIGGNGQAAVTGGGTGAGLFGGIGSNSGGYHSYSAGAGGAGAYISGGQAGNLNGGTGGNGGIGLIVLGGYDSSTSTRSNAIQATGNITLGTGYTVDGVDVSQQNATPG